MVHKQSLPFFNAKQNNAPIIIPAKSKILTQRINSIDKLIEYISPFRTKQNSMAYTAQEFTKKQDISTSPNLLQTPSVDIGSALKFNEAKIPSLQSNSCLRNNRSARNIKVKRFAKYNQIPMSAPLQVNGSSFTRLEKNGKDCMQQNLSNTQLLYHTITEKENKKVNKIHIKGFTMRRDKCIEYMRLLNFFKPPKVPKEVPPIIFGSMIDRYRSQYNCKDIHLKALLKV